MRKLIENFFKSRIIRIAILLLAFIGVAMYADGHIKNDINMMRQIVSLEEGLLKQTRYIHMLEVQSSDLNAKIRKCEEEASDASAMGLEIIASAIHPRILWSMMNKKVVQPRECLAIQKFLTSLRQTTQKLYETKKFNAAQRNYLYKVIVLEKIYFLKICSK
jgi:hypothetical protein